MSPALVIPSRIGIDRRRLVIAAVSSVFALAGARAEPVARWSGAMRLSRRLTRISLHPHGDPALLERLRGGGVQQASLLIRGLYATSATSEVFDIFLGADDASNLNRNDPGFAGSLNFFGMPTDPQASTRAVNLAIGDNLRRLAQMGRLKENIAIDFVARAMPHSVAGFASVELIVD